MPARRIVVTACAMAVLIGSSAFAASPAKTERKGAVRAAAKSPAKAVTKVDPNMAAVVNGQKITTKQLQDTMYKWYSPQGVEEMVLVNLVDREAKKAGVVVKESEVQARIAEIEKRSPAGGGSFVDYLKQTGKTLDYARAMIRLNLQANAIIRKREKVTAQDLASYRKAEHILVMNPDATTPPAAETDPAKAEADKDKALIEKMDKIAKEIKNGLSFEEAAKKYSEDTMTKVNGGDLGWFTSGRMVPEFEKAAFALKVGEISGPIKTAYGYHLIKVTALGSEAKGEERKQLEEKILQSRVNLQSWLADIRARAKVQSAFLPSKRPQPRTPSKLSPMPTRVKPPFPGVRPAPVPTPKVQETPPAPPSAPSSAPAEPAK